MNTIQLHAGREVIYACLSNIFLDAPNTKADFHDMLDIFVDAVSYMKDNNENISDSAASLSAFIDKRNELSGIELETFDKDMARAYTALYCLTNSVHLFESVYTSPSGLMMQESTERVMRLYKQYAFDMNHYSNEPADHISYELMFMAYLAKRTVKLLADNELDKAQMLIATQKAFLNGNLLSWVDDFAHATASRPQAESLYAPVARFMAEYLREDAEILELLELQNT